MNHNFQEKKMIRAAKHPTFQPIQWMQLKISISGVGQLAVNKKN